MTTTLASQDSLLGLYQRYPVTIARGEGCYVFDTEGRRYLDAVTGIGVNALGHGHPRIVRAIVEQAGQIMHVSNHYNHPYQEPLAAKLCVLSGLDRVFFANSGTEAMEAALKACRARGNKLGKTKVVAIERSFHGRTIGSLAVTGQKKYREPFEPLTPEVTFVPANDMEALTATIDSRTAAVVLEPILGEGGVIPLTEEFLLSARALTTRHGALLIADEIQCGLGRTGRVFAHQWAGIRPDIITVAKPLAGGLPMGATLLTEEAASYLPAGSHGTTSGGNPLACRVALEFLSVMEDLLPQVEQIGAYLYEQLTELWSRHGAIREVRGRGLMLALELNRPARPCTERALDHGLLVNATQENVLRMLPPYVLGWAEAEELVTKVGKLF